MARRRRRIRTSDIVHELMSHLGTMAIIGPGRLTAQKNDGFRAVDALLVSINHLAAVARIRIPRSESDVDGTWVAAAEFALTNRELEVLPLIVAGPTPR
jgi:hypothetical protein